LRLLAAAVALAAVLAFVAWRGHVWDVDDALRNVDAAVVVTILGLSVAQGVPLALREQAIVGALGWRVSARSLAAIAYFGNTASLFTPAGSAEVLRPAMMQRATGLEAAPSVALVAYERFYSYAICGLAAPVAFLVAALPAELRVLPLVALAAVSLAIPAGYRYVLRPMMSRSGGPSRMQRSIEVRTGISFGDAGTSLSRLTDSVRVTLIFTGWTFVVLALLGLQFWLAVNAITAEVSPPEAWSVLMVSTLVGVLSLLPMGLGTTDGMMLALLHGYGASQPEAVAVVLLYRTTIFLPMALLGVGAYLVARRGGGAALSTSM
jgi:uncharacterized protein (TIRG00374 family)